MLAGAHKQLDEIRKRVQDDTNDADLLKQRGARLDIQAKADALAPRLACVTARLSELGIPPDGAREVPEVAAQHMQLEKNSRALDVQIKPARLLSVDAAPTAEQLSSLHRTQFQARLGERRDSFTSGQFWAEFRKEFPGDLKRLVALRDDLATAVGHGAGCCSRPRLPRHGTVPQRRAATALHAGGGLGNRRKPYGGFPRICRCSGMAQAGGGLLRRTAPGTPRTK